MSKIRLDLNQFQASGIYSLEVDASQSIVLNTQTTRLVVGFSKKGPINAPVYCPDVKTARRIFGDIDKDLERKGSFFHRSLFTCLETGPCFALLLMPLNDDTSTSNPDYDIYKSFSLSTTEANGSTASALYSSYYNKERFYFPDSTYFQATVDANATNTGKLLSFTNLGQTPFSIIVRKTGDLKGFTLTARDWFGAGNVPAFVREFDYVSEYFINIDIIEGDWTNYSQLAIDPIYSTYFTSSGLLTGKLASFLAANGITRLGSFQGSLIPDFIDGNGVNYSIDTIVNAAIATTGLFVTLNRDALADYVMGMTASTGVVDLVGHSLIQNSVSTVDMLSYNFAAQEYFDYTNTASFTLSDQVNFGTGATSSLPGGTGSTGAAYAASANGYSQNDPAKAAYLTSFYGSGNEGRFNNKLNIRKEALSATQYSNLLNNITAGSSIALQGATGATQYCTVTSVTETTVSSNTRLVLGIAHPLKSLEGQTSGKTASVSAVGATYMVVGGTAAYTNINVGDWIYAENTGQRYYFRVTGTGLTGATAYSQLYVDTTNSEFSGSTNISLLTTYFNIYWESIKGAAGSLFDVISPYQTSNLASLKVYDSPDIFEYVSPGASSANYYRAYEFSPSYIAFEDGVLANSDVAYITGPTPLYLSASFTQTGDGVKIANINAFRDSSLTIGYTGSWTFSTIKDSAGATVSPTALRIYSLVGDYSASIGATGFNSSYTTMYVTSAAQGDIQVGNYVVADPDNTGDSADYILTRVISKKLMSSGTYSGYYQINTNQRMVNYTGTVTRYKKVEDVAPAYQPTYLPGFKIGSYHLPGTAAQLAKILGMLDSANSNLYDTLSSRHIIAFRYIIDTFSGGLNAQSYPKNLITLLAQNRQKCLAIMNAPSIQEFINSTDPRFTELPTTANPKPLLNTAYIADGGNLSLGPSYVYSLPDEENGAKFSGFFSPFLMIRENNKNVSIPPAADVSNNFIRKFINGQPYSIVAGPRRGVLSNPLLVGLEYDFTDTDRGNVEPIGWNPIVFRRGTGFMIYGNQSAYQKTPSAFNNLHTRDLLITIEEAVEDILGNFLFEFNDSSTRLQIKSIVDSYLDNVRSGGGLFDYKTIIDESNNTPDIIDGNFCILDIGVEIARGAQKFINRVTVLKTGSVSSGGFSVV